MDQFVSICCVRNGSGAVEALTPTIPFCNFIIHFRLADDFGTSSEEIKGGDVPKSIQCYMHEKGCSEEEARVYIRNLIYELAKKMNKETLLAEKSLKCFGVTALNLVRMSLCFYLNYGDGFGVNPNSETKKNLVSLIVDPIPM